MFNIYERRSYAKADFDRTLQYVQSYIYKLPFGRGQSLLKSGVGSKILGGWQVTGITSLRTGRPFSVTCGCGNLNTPALSQTANQIAEVDLPKGINVGNPWFDTAAFATVPSVPI